MVEEMPHAVIADRDAALDQFRQQFATGDVGLLGEPGAYPLRLIGQLPMGGKKPFKNMPASGTPSRADFSLKRSRSSALPLVEYPQSPGSATSPGRTSLLLGRAIALVMGEVDRR